MKYVLFYTWAKYRPVKTKKEGKRLMKVWQRWYERKGWTTQSFAKAEAIRAYPPGFVNDGVGEHNVGVVHVICLRDNVLAL